MAKKAKIDVSRINVLIKKEKKLLARAKKEKDDREFISMMRADIKDYQKGKKLAKKDDMPRLGKLLRKMDTYPREKFVSALPKYMQQDLGYE